MKINFKIKENIIIKMTQDAIIKLKYVALNAMQFITCGHEKATCDEFVCDEEVEIPEL